jgi:protoheme IX farnesyltransferase
LALLWVNSNADMMNNDATILEAEAAFAKRDVVSTGGVADYFALLKPRVMSLAIFTAGVGMAIAPVHIHPVLAFISLLMIAVGAGAAGALNMWYDADIDSLMQRTAKRPIPRGRVRAEDALAFGLFLAAMSVLTLGLLVNWMAAFLLALSIGFYIVIYTAWLKRRTPQNIVIGGAAGALPPMIGWAAATSGVSLESVCLFTIIFLWTPPHFWSLALYRARDYGRAGIPMMPNVHGQGHTRLEILLYTIATALAGLAPALLGFAGPIFGISSAVLGVLFIFYAWRVFRSEEGYEGDRKALKLFVFSIFYLFALFGVLGIEHGLGLVK